MRVVLHRPDRQLECGGDFLFDRPEAGHHGDVRSAAVEACAVPHRWRAA